MIVPFIRFHGRNSKFRHNYVYYKDELKHGWIDKVKDIISKTKYLNLFYDHYGVKAVINALEFNKI